MTQPLRAVVVEGSAKINLGWRVGVRREDGYHDVYGLIQTISLRDRLEISPMNEDDDAPLVTLDVPDHPDLATSDNLVVKAAEALADRGRSRPVRVVLRKSIPVAAGLGGGSADAAAALVALNVLWSARLTPAALLQIAAGVGSDVPAIVRGGLVRVAGRGERTGDAGPPHSGHVVLGVTATPVAAADVYAAFDRVGGGAAADETHNDLERAACDLVPGLAERVGAMREVADAAFVSGSGPTVVGLVATQAAAERAAAAVEGVFDRVLLASPSSWGVRLTPAT
jgi:4-diphosphocytidyl-2-C-methyl-D-erythritol kinase